MQRRARQLLRALCLTGAVSIALAQTAKAPSTDKPYVINVSVDEVSLTFHAADFHGIPIDDLNQSDLRLRDNGKPPKHIVFFARYKNLPVRIGVLMDTSRSMLGYIRHNRFVASEYLEQLFKTQDDSGFLMRFDSQSKILQDWTRDRILLASGLSTIASDSNSRIGGTVLFDSIYKACRDQFRPTVTTTAGNFIMLFSDGIDNASHARLEDDIDMCQKANTPIFVFSDESSALFSEGQKTLRELAAKSGGAIFFDETPEAILHDLQVIDANLRSQYRLVYKPKSLKRDGSFHRIKLDSPTRGGVITTRSGYYAIP
jgi:Ca-activated chloride channel homolog